MRRRQRVDVARCERLIANRLPRRRGFGVERDQRLVRHAGRQFDDERIVRLLDFDPGEAIAEKILTLTPVHGLGNDLQ